jgi:hypothetical protein
MFDDLATPANDSMKKCLDNLLTQPLAKLLRNRRPWDLLTALNENIETTTKIWNLSMRKELLEFITKVDKDRAPGSNDNDLLPAADFIFSCIKGKYYSNLHNKYKIIITIKTNYVLVEYTLEYLIKQEIHQISMTHLNFAEIYLNMFVHF